MSELVRYFARHYTLVLDNTQAYHEDVNQLVRDVMVNEGVPLTEFRTMSARERDENFAGLIGAEVLDYIEQAVSGQMDGVPGLGAELIREVMLTHGSDLRWELGKHYVPEVSDASEYLTDEDES